MATLVLDEDFYLLMPSNPTPVVTDLFRGQPLAVLIAQVIDASMKTRRWKRRQLWREMADYWEAQGVENYPAVATLNRWCNATVIEVYRHSADRLPPLAYVAPFLFRAVQIQGQVVWLNLEELYGEEGWTDLFELHNIVVPTPTTSPRTDPPNGQSGQSDRNNNSNFHPCQLALAATLGHPLYPR